MNKEIFDKWNDTGFLDGLDDNDKPKLANQFETMIKYILIKTKHSNNSQLESLIFPIIRRVLEGTKFKHEFEPKELVDAVTDIMNSNEYKGIESSICYYNYIDCESELTDYIVKTYIKNIKD